jgi:hypothetical protein
MLETTLTIAQRMLAIGMNEEEVAQELVSFLIHKYGIKPQDQSVRVVCQNTVIHSEPVLSN